MASSLIRFRRGLRILSGLNQSFSAASTSLSVPIQGSISSSGSRWESPNVGVQCRLFMSKSISLLSARSPQPQMNFPDDIGPDTILFEGCDYHHWLFVMDFPKDNKPPPEVMIRVYEETCAKGLNISVEEAKKKIYACSTTTYTGFQAVMTEEESTNFEGLSGVIFVLPDSYIDPVNKEYGGDKYIDGTIIPRPPPVQYGRNQGRRDRNRSPDQYNRQENPMPNPGGNPFYNNRASVPGYGRNYGPSQSYPPQQNYGQASQNYPPQQNYGQASQNYPPQQNFNQAPQNYPLQQSHGQASQSYPPQQNINQASQNYPPRQQTYGSASPQYAQQQSFGPPGQAERRNYVPQQNFGQPGKGERTEFPCEGRDNTIPPSYVTSGFDFKPSYLEEFEQNEKGNYLSKEQMGSQQRYPPPGHGNFTGEV